MKTQNNKVVVTIRRDGKVQSHFHGKIIAESSTHVKVVHADNAEVGEWFPWNSKNTCVVREA